MLMGKLVAEVDSSTSVLKVVCTCDGYLETVMCDACVKDKEEGCKYRKRSPGTIVCKCTSDRMRKQRIGELENFLERVKSVGK